MLRFALLVFAAVLPPLSAYAQGCGSSSLSCQQLAIQDAQAAGIDPATFLAQIQAESNFNPNAVNNASGATGIAQFLPSTAANAGYGIAAFDPTDPVASLQAAAQYDAALQQQYGSLTAALTAYSGGLTPANPGDYGQAFTDAAAADAGNPQAIGGATVTPASSVTAGGGALGGNTTVTNLPGTGSGAGSGVLDQIVQTFQGATQGWQTTLFNLATYSFWTIALIELVYSLYLLGTTQDGGTGAGVVFTIIHWLVPTGLFWWLMQSGSYLAGLIVQSLQQAGLAIGGVGVTPSTVFWAGVNIVTTIWNNMHGFMDAINEIPVMLAAIPMIFMFALAAVWMMMVLIEAYFVIGLAALFLAFGAMRWTRAIAITLLMTCVAVGFKLLAIEVICGLGTGLITQWAQNAAGLSMQGIFIMLGASVAFAALVKLVPDRLERIVQGYTASMAHYSQPIREAGAAAAAVAAPVAGAAGFGMLMWQLLKHAAETEARGTPLLEGPGRAATIASALGGAAGSEISGRLGGLYRGGAAASTARMAANVRTQRAVAAAEAGRPQPPSGGASP